MDINEKFKQYFPRLKKQFELKPFQKDVIDKVVRKENTLAIMPTGSGKSLIYWISGLALNGITFVISPLTALIDEQSLKLSNEGYEVLTIHSGLNSAEQIKLLTKFYNKKINPSFIFASPERMATDGYFEFVLKSRFKEIKLFVIDEAHCISQWGFDFRPFYKRIPRFLNSIFENTPPSVLALTATLNPKDLAEIRNDFEIKHVIKDDFLLRNEIELKAIKFADENQKEEKLWQLLEIHRDEKTIVYLYRKYNKRGTEDLTQKAIDKGFNAINFHGDMSAEERREIIKSFKLGKHKLVFATNAFGMGIDIPDIRVVIHFMIPESVEQYYQEIGRSARDKKASVAYILYTNKNVSVRKSHFIDKSFPSNEDLARIHKKITDNKLGLKTLQYFDDEEVQHCLPYFLENDIISIRSKAFTNLNLFAEIENAELNELYNLTTTKGIITTIKKSSKSADQIAKLVYTAIAGNKATLAKPLDKCIIIENHVAELTDNQLNSMQESMEEKKEYKHNLLDYLKYLLDNTSSSKELHQEIGLYLGMDKHKVNRIYKTEKGDMVRSKSEVIIANLLYNHEIPYEYEKKLFYKASKWLEPDFTIKIDGSEYYWEHLGMIGTETYDNRWIEKKAIYNDYFPEKLKITYESAVLTDSALDLINELRASNLKGTS
jgi:ATP-dependent DNA helicase RecQ